jgi:TonB family protein
MLGQLIESRPRRDGRGREVLVSVAVHAVIVAGLVAGAAGRGDGGALAGQPEQLTYVHTSDPAPGERGGAMREAASEDVVVEEHRLPAGDTDVDLPVVEIESVLPGIPLEITGDPGRVLEKRIAGIGGSDWSGGEAAGGSSTERGLFSVDQVEQPPVVVRAARPIYPPLMQSRGVEGSITVRFVIDQRGSVTASSIRVVDGDEPLFIDAVRRALAGARFRPARIGGRAVSVLVEQSFGFRIDR